MALKFGTGGIRGIMGAGEEHFSAKTIIKATSGLCRWILSADGDKARTGGVVIAYDTRNNSREFAEKAAGVLIGAGIPAHMFKEPTPTPVLSFAVRHMGCAAGIVITASHNPKEYNGYKVYNAEGCQLVPREATALAALITDEEGIISEEPASEVPESVNEAFFEAIKEQSLFDDIGAKRALKVIYTPLHGTGHRFVRDVLGDDYDVEILQSQKSPNGDFPTVKSPNPEDGDALSLAIERGRTTRADIVIGTDPDCDRVGVAVSYGGGWQVMTGNQMGALLTDFILTLGRPEGGAIIKTIVTNDLGAELARKAGLEVIETLTGFKYIGERICQFEKNGESFVFGYEESYGYLKGTHARDKDAVIASMLICEMAAYHKKNGLTLYEVLNKLYMENGYYLDALDTIEIDVDRAAEAIKLLRQRGAAAFTERCSVIDYSLGVEGLPKENVLKFVFQHGWLAMRPSGTEPKLKIYYSVTGKSRTQAGLILSSLRFQVKKILQM